MTRVILQFGVNVRGARMLDVAEEGMSLDACQVLLQLLDGRLLMPPWEASSAGARPPGGVSSLAAALAAFLRAIGR